MAASVGHMLLCSFCNGYLHCRTRTPIGVQISVPKMGTVAIEDLSPNRDPNLSLFNGNSFCTVQCSLWVWNLNPCPAMWKSHNTKFCDRNSIGIINGTSTWKHKPVAFLIIVRQNMFLPAACVGIWHRWYVANFYCSQNVQINFTGLQPVKCTH